MPNNSFTQLWEDADGEEYEVTYHFEGSHFRGTLEEPPEEPWIEIDSIISIADGGSLVMEDYSAIEKYLNNNHDYSSEDDTDDYYGEDY